MKIAKILPIIMLVLGLSACNKPTGELVGAYTAGPMGDADPYGMQFIRKGAFLMGPNSESAVFSQPGDPKTVTVNAFWMDETEVSNAKYRQFVFWVRDSIIRERLADPAFGGDETFKITEDEFGEPIKPYLNWKKPIPWKKPTEDELRAIESVYIKNPITGEKMLDASQMNYRYEEYDYTQAALRKNRINPSERNRNTDIPVDHESVVMISKDTAYIDDEGNIVRETINRPLSSPYDFLNTYIINIYPDTTCWVNDFPNANNETYLQLYFSHPNYSDYPVVGISWEQANAFCAWRTDFLMKGLGGYAKQIQRYRLPTEIEWEYAARGGNKSNGYKYAGSNTLSNVAWYKNNSSTTHPVRQQEANELGLYDMSGNVWEWCQDWYGSYISSHQTNPKGVSSGSNRVDRGGGWRSNARGCRVSNRDDDSPTLHNDLLGLRLVL